MFANDSFIPFAQQFYSKLVGEYSKSNCFVSPLSVYSSLSLALCGSANKSRSELLSALHVKDAADFDATVASLGKALLSVPDGDPGRTLVLANGLFVDKTLSMKKCFTEALEHNFKVKAQEVNFVSASEAARHAINKWVADNTCQKIAELMPPDSIDSQTRLVLANAIYFKGTWRTVFHRDMTCDWPFYTLNGEEINVPMMGDTAAYPFAEFPELKASGLKIPFKAHEMLIVLPNERDGLPELLRTLGDHKHLEHFKALFNTKKYETGRFELRLPRFTLGGSSIDLKRPLGEMGLESVFKDSEADFSRISDCASLCISKIVHQAMIEVNEEGAEAAAATGMTISACCLSPQFIVDRPFLFFIVTETGFPAFMGHVVNPLG